ncbi:MAG: nuclear transport factor 2 family protein [Actinomycetota bacterium]
MTDEELITAYLTATTPGAIDLETTRSLLHDDVVVHDPLMSFEGADAYVEALGQTPRGEMSSTVEYVLTGDGVAAAKVLFEAPGLTVDFAQWLWFDHGRSRRIQVIYDPRPFLEAAG